MNIILWLFIIYLICGIFCTVVGSIDCMKHNIAVSVLGMIYLTLFWPFILLNIEIKW